MLTDLVVDTNIFVHAHNKGLGARHDEALALTRRLIADEVTTVLRVDPGFHVDESRNTSKIGAEYLAFVVPGMLGHAVIQRLAAGMRVQPVDTALDEETRVAVNALVQDESDRIFLRVTLNSDERVLASHDDAAFPDDVRDECEARWSMVLGEAIDALGRMHA